VCRRERRGTVRQHRGQSHVPSIFPRCTGRMAHAACSRRRAQVLAQAQAGRGLKQAQGTGYRHRHRQRPQAGTGYRVHGTGASTARGKGQAWATNTCMFPQTPLHTPPRQTHCNHTHTAPLRAHPQYRTQTTHVRKRPHLPQPHVPGSVDSRWRDDPRGDHLPLGVGDAAPAPALPPAARRDVEDRALAGRVRALAPEGSAGSRPPAPAPLPFTLSSSRMLVGAGDRTRRCLAATAAAAEAEAAVVPVPPEAVPAKGWGC
jgi:hypothetical protein